MEPVSDFLDTFEKVRKARRSLEKTTEVDFRKYAEARRRMYHESKNIVLD